MKPEYYEKNKNGISQITDTSSRRSEWYSELLWDFEYNRKNLDRYIVHNGKFVIIDIDGK